MAFYIEMPKDEYGNVGFPPSVLEGDVAPWPADNRLMQLTIREPKEIADRWPTTLLMHGWVECEGPARMLSYEEHKEITDAIIANDPRKAGAGTVMYDGERIPIGLAAVLETNKHFDRIKDD